MGTTVEVKHEVNIAEVKHSAAGVFRRRRVHAVL